MSPRGQSKGSARVGAEPELIEANRHWLEPFFLEPGDTWSLDFRSWILKIDDKIVVIDPCTGNHRPHPIAAFDNLDTPYIERFCATGVRPAEVDYVFCTHMHHDHCGWNTQLRDGRWVPTFPNARYLFLQREYERWTPNGAHYRRVDYNDGVFERSIQPIVDAGQADFIVGSYRISPSLDVMDAPGHTLGHAMLRLESDTRTAYFTGDCFHHPLQLIEPRIQFGDADDLASAIETRRLPSNLSLERDALLIPAHLPKPHAGRVRHAGHGIIFDGLTSTN